MNNIGFTYGSYKFENYGDMGELCIYKDKDIWQTYVMERNQIFGAMAFDNLYHACVDIFKSLDLFSTKYCLESFIKLLKKDYDINEINLYFNKITEMYNLNNKNCFKESNYGVDSLKVSTYSPGNSENIAALLDNFEYNPEEKEKVLAKYKSLKNKYIK